MLKRKPRRSREFKKNSDNVIDYEAAREARAEKRKDLSKVKARERREEKIREKEETSQYSARKNAQKTRRRLMYLAVIVIVVALVSVPAYRLITLKIQQNDLLAENQALVEEKDALQDELDHVTSPEYIEQKAREILQLVKPGERLYIFPGSRDETGEDEQGGDETTTGGAV